MEAHKTKPIWPQGAQGRVPAICLQSTQRRQLSVHQLLRTLRLAECLGVIALLVGGAFEIFSVTQWLFVDRLFLAHHMTPLIVSGFAIVAGSQLFVTSSWASATLFSAEEALQVT